jgi:cysteinyl-tRNA synthetase
MIVLLGNELASAPRRREADWEPLVEALLDLRQRLRSDHQWEAADALRDALKTVNIQVEDTPDGHRWHLLTPSST